MPIVEIKGKKFNVIPLMSAKPFPKSKYQVKKDGDLVKSKRLRQIEKGMIRI